MAQALELPVSLADSELESYRRIGTQSIVDIRTWNEKSVSVSFHDVIGLREHLAGNFSDLVQDLPASQDLLKDAIARNFDNVPAGHPYRVYAFLNVDGDPSLEIVASSLEITVR